MKDYEMELRLVVKIHSHDIDAAQNQATKIRQAMRHEFPEIDMMEFATDYSLRPCERPVQNHHIRTTGGVSVSPDPRLKSYPDPHNAGKVFRSHAARAE
jgi:hypothetical protein